MVYFCNTAYVNMFYKTFTYFMDVLSCLGNLLSDLKYH